MLGNKWDHFLELREALDKEGNKLTEKHLDRIANIIVKERRNAYYVSDYKETEPCTVKFKRLLTSLATQILTVEMPKASIVRLKFFL